MKSRGIPPCFSLILTLLIPALSWGAAKPEKRFSLALYPSFVIGAFDSTYTHAFIPGPLSALPGSGASQVLTLQGSSEAGLALGFGYRVNEFLGIRLMVGRAASGIKGENSPYAVIMKYASRQPPSYELKEYTYDGTRPWVSTSGTLKTLSAVVGLEFGHNFSRMLRAAVTLGAGLYRVWGEFGPLGFTTIWLGGHSVLFAENYLLFLKIPPSWKPGLDLGAELALSLGRGVFLSLRGGYSLVGTLMAVPLLDGVQDYESLGPILPEDTSAIAAAISLGPLRLSPSSFRFGVGLGINI